MKLIVEGTWIGFLLNTSSGSDLLEKELDVAKVEAEIAVLADFILAVESRKTQLAA
jgi:hypothetical protein